MSDIECPLPKRSQLRAARSESGEDSQETPITAAIPLDLDPAAPPPPRAAVTRHEAAPDEAAPASPVAEPENVAEPESQAEPEDRAELESEAEPGSEAPASSAGRRRDVHPVGYVLRALLVLGLAGTTIAVPMTGRVGSDSSLTVPARAFGTSVGGPSWAVSSALPQATALDGTLTANSRAKAKAPVSITGCASGNGADGNRNVRVVADTIYWPLPEGSYTITSPFTMRISPVSGQLLAHEGIDMAAPLDTPITAVYGGVVEEVAENSRSGAYVQIKHTKSDGTVFHSAYLHQYMNKIKVKVGDTVTAGQVIGAVGNNGWSTGPHLHFEIHDSSDTPVDPESWMEANKAVYLGQESCS
ncbi:M23 family metallopeptidase [Pauljensenia sp. 20925_1_27]